MASVLGYLKSCNIVYPLTSKNTLIGRSPSCNIILNHLSISKDHALISYDEKGDNPIIK